MNIVAFVIAMVVFVLGFALFALAFSVTSLQAPIFFVGILLVSLAVYIPVQALRK
ncbi:MAG: hypothetical protein R6W83_01460 [Cryobacterium sp.]